MESHLGRRVIHFANLPIKLLMSSLPFDHIRKITLKMIPSALKIEIRRVLESLYDFEIDEVRTLNVEGKKKKHEGFLAAKPDYKKAYVTLRSPFSILPDLFPIRVIQEDREQIEQALKSKPVVVEETGRSHWLDDPDRDRESNNRRRHGGRRAPDERKSGRKGGSGKNKEKSTSIFSWSSM